MIARKLITTLLLAGSALCAIVTSSANAAPLGVSRSIGQLESAVETVARRGGVARGGMARRSTFVGPRGGVARTTTVRRGAVARPGWHGGGTRRVAPGVRPGVRWARPGGYWWRPGGAIVAGAAIGFVSAATAAAWAGAPPAPNMCWYYTDASRTNGFWDVCP
jgi:hypothetical protein